MKLSSWVRPLAFVAPLVITTVASAQNGGRDDDAPAPAAAPTYAPPPTYTAPPPYGGPTYAAPPPSGPKRMPYDEGDPVPAGYHVSTHTRSGLLISGGIVFGVFYGLTVIGASGSTDPDTRWLYMPVAGPVLYGNTIHGDFAFIPRFFLWIDTIAQATGATLLAVGFVPKTELVRNDLATVHVTPVVTGSTTGLAFYGAF